MKFFNNLILCGQLASRGSGLLLFSDSGSVAVEVGDDEDYHFVLKAYGQSKNVIHIPTELVQVLDTMKEWFRTR